LKCTRDLNLGSVTTSSSPHGHLYGAFSVVFASNPGNLIRPIMKPKHSIHRKRDTQATLSAYLVQRWNKTEFGSQGSRRCNSADFAVRVLAHRPIYHHPLTFLDVHWHTLYGPRVIRLTDAVHWERTCKCWNKEVPEHIILEKIIRWPLIDGSWRSDRGASRWKTTRRAGYSSFWEVR
jgi:hypothetical protein